MTISMDPDQLPTYVTPSNPTYIEHRVTWRHVETYGEG